MAPSSSRASGWGAADSIFRSGTPFSVITVVTVNFGCGTASVRTTNERPRDSTRVNRPNPNVASEGPSSTRSTSGQSPGGAFTAVSPAFTTMRTGETRTDVRAGAGGGALVSPIRTRSGDVVACSLRSSSGGGGAVTGRVTTPGAVAEGGAATGTRRTAAVLVVCAAAVSGRVGVRSLAFS